MREFDKAYRMQVTSAPPTEPGSPGEGPSGLRVVPVAGLAEDVLKRSGIRRGMRVLDLECGTGETSLAIARLVGYSGLIVRVASITAGNRCGRKARNDGGLLLLDAVCCGRSRIFPCA
jgi:hypothetical protein